MEIEAKQKKEKFKPIELKITLTTIKEAEALCCICNHSSIGGAVKEYIDIYSIKESIEKACEDCSFRNLWSEFNEKITIQFNGRA